MEPSTKESDQASIESAYVYPLRPNTYAMLIDDSSDEVVMGFDRIHQFLSHLVPSKARLVLEYLEDNDPFIVIVPSRELVQLIPALNETPETATEMLQRLRSAGEVEIQQQKREQERKSGSRSMADYFRTSDNSIEDISHGHHPQKANTIRGMTGRVLQMWGKRGR